MKKQKGQTMLELVITMGLILVIVSAVTISSLNGLQESQFSQDQVQATKLAQEGIERIRVIKQRNYMVCTTTPVATTKFSDLFTSSCPTATPCKYILSSGGSSSCGTTTPYWLNNTSPYYDQPTGTKFQRFIEIRDFPSTGTLTQKEIVVKVSWSNSSGSHQSNLTTVLTPN